MENMSDNAKYSLVLGIVISDGLEHGITTEKEMEQYLKSDFGLKQFKTFWDMM